MRKGIGLDIVVVVLGVIMGCAIGCFIAISDQRDTPVEYIPVEYIPDEYVPYDYNNIPNDSNFSDIYFEIKPDIGVSPTMSYYDVVWLRDTNEVIFEWKDGKFNVIYDSNDCTESAITFFKCLLETFPNIKEKICSEVKR